MSITINGQSSVPPGFRFHPTEEELLNYYLRKKVASEKIDLDVIRDVDLNKLEPWDIQEKCRIGSTPQNDWYFFSHKDKKYPTGTRTNRATAAGFWKATGRDKGIYSSFKRIGMRKTLVFYKGRAPHGQKSDWIMHEYRLDEQQSDDDDANLLSRVVISMGESANQEDGWVVCRVFKKKNFLRKSSESSTAMIAMDTKSDFQTRNGDGTLDEIIQCMGGRACKQIEPRNSLFFSERYMKLPPLESYHQHENSTSYGINNQGGSGEVGLRDWVALDRLVASQLNGQSSSKQIACFNENILMDYYGSDNNVSEEGSGGDGDLWSLASSSA